jgi:hypothetical protein
VKNLEKVADVLSSEEKVELVRLLKKLGHHANRMELK